MIVEVGEVANRQTALASFGSEDTAVISVAVCSAKPVELIISRFHVVLYQEKLYAAGKIRAGSSKEGRPSGHETLISRLIDRPLRPLFPEGFRNEVQVVNTVLSANPDHSSEMAAMLRIVGCADNFRNSF